MRISARNQLAGTVAGITEGAVNGVVAIDLADRRITADITMAAIDELGLAVGAPAVAIVKANNVLFAAGRDHIAGLSARNQLAGTVARVQRGAVNGIVALELPDGQVVTGSITNAAIDELGLAPGVPAVAIVKASDVLVGVEA